MWVPMAIVALTTIIMGVLAPFIITGFHEFFSPLLNQCINHYSIVDVIKKTFLSPTFGMTCAALAIGGYPAYQMYITRRVNPGNVSDKHPYLKEIHTFFQNRCYIDTLYYEIADKTKALSKVMHKHLELGGIDAFNYLIAQNAMKFCQAFRKTHTGILSWSMIGVMLGIPLLLILLFVLGGYIP